MQFCDDCGSNVDLALLTAPACPHCASTVTDVEKRASILGSHRLLTGELPALEGRVDGEADAESVAADRFADLQTDADATAQLTETEDDMTTTMDVGDTDR